MSNLSKATLQEIGSGDPERTIGDPVEVQFNPSSLRLQIANQIEGNRSRGRQVRQYTGSSSSTLSLDLIFDTADEGATGQPRSVREKTFIVEKYVLPKGEGDQKQAPPKLRFQWGDLLVTGIVDTISIDFDHFASDGTPLRAKVSLSIKEQDPKYQFGSTGPMANQQGGTPEPGIALPGFPGAPSGGEGGNRSAPSLAGESAAEFAARMGLDAEAWRGLSFGGDALSLSAGVEVGFRAGLDLNAGVGLSAGIEAGASSSLEASFGLEAGGGAGASGGSASGFNLSAAGGVEAALQSVAITRAGQAAQKAREAFGAARPGSVAAPPPSPALSASEDGGATRTEASASPAGGPALPRQQRPRLGDTGLPSPACRQAAQPAPPIPRADPRSTSFGAGVPLRPRLGEAGAVAGRRGSSTALNIAAGDEPPLTDIPTTPPWVALPARDPARRAADAEENRSRPRRPCGCHGPCGHRGGK